MLYIASLGKRGLTKVGVTDNIERRMAQLRIELNAPRLRLIRKIVVPYGWGSERKWEAELITRLKNCGGTLQLYSPTVDSTEVVDASIEDALEALRSMTSITEIDHMLDADQVDPNREDWRFYPFWHQRRCYSMPFGFEHKLSEWQDVINRQIFIHWLRRDECAPMPKRFL